MFTEEENNKEDEKQQLVNVCITENDNIVTTPTSQQSSHTHSHSHSHSNTLEQISSIKDNKTTAAHHSTRVAYVSERKPGKKTKDPAPGKGSASGSMTGAKDNSKKTQAALLRLLAAFREPPPSIAADQLALIRQQQDDLARLHFKLGSDPDAPAKPVSARETMARLVHSLEQLSGSIEQLHTMTDHSRPSADNGL